MVIVRTEGKDGVVVPIPDMQAALRNMLSGVLVTENRVIIAAVDARRKKRRA